MDMSLLQTKMKPATPLPELQTVEDIYRWIDENIAYGWQDKDGGTHTSEMKDFRRLYRTMSVTETRSTYLNKIHDFRSQHLRNLH